LRIVRSSRLLALVGCVVVGCGTAVPEAAPEEEVAVAAALEADIGPEGGEIVAPADGPNAGFALRIPAGALSSTVHVVVRGALDATPLPATAAGIGPQVSLLPEGTALAKPARLTVPFDAATRARHRDAASECKVWAREGDGWKRLEQVASDEQGVTVEIATFATSAAGVVLRSKPVTLCDGGRCRVVLPSGNAAQDEPCTSPNGYCVSRLTDPSRSFMLGDSEQLSVVGNAAFYGHLPGAERATIVKYDIATGQSSTFVELAEPGGTGFRYPRGRVAVDADGSAWLGIHGTGNVRFRASAPASVFDRDRLFAHGVAIDQGAVVRLTSRFATDDPNPWHRSRIFGARRDANEQTLFRYEDGDAILLGTPGVGGGARFLAVTPFNGFEQFTFAPGAFTGALRDTRNDGTRAYGAAAVSPVDQSYAVANAAYKSLARSTFASPPVSPAPSCSPPKIPSCRWRSTPATTCTS